MFPRTFFPHPLAGWVMPLVMMCAVSQAQDFLPGAERPPIDVDETTPSGGEEDPFASGFSDESRDPTAPPSQLLERIPKPVPTPIPRSTANLKPTRSSVAKVPTVVSLPALPEITLRGIVLSSPERGTAMLSVNEASVNIALLPRESQQRIPVPEVQFASMKAALDHRSAMSKAASNRSGTSEKRKQYEMCLQCSFAVGEIIFNVEAFTRDTVLLRAIPHDSLIIVRK